MPYRDEHAARQNPPNKYTKTVRVNKEKGVSFLIGTLPDGKTEVQSIRFDADRFTASAAREWLRANDMDPSKFEAATGKVAREDSDDLEVFRFDSGKASKFRVDSAGFGHFDQGTLSTVGVYKYKNADGSIRSEFRPPEEVQSKRFINSLKNCVLTREHPYPRGTAVNRKNVKKLGVGTTGTDVRANGLKVDSSLTVRDEDTLIAVAEKVDSGQPVGLSVGYRCKTRKESGVWNGPNGPVPYTHVQYGHVANHVAITISTRPRGGLDKQHGTVLHLDSHEAEQLTEGNTHTMDTVNIKVGEFELTVLAAHAPMLQAHLEKVDSVAVDNAKKIGALEGEVESLKATNEKLTTDSESLPNLGALVAARQKLLTNAVKIVDQKALDKVDSDAEDFNQQVLQLCLDSRKVAVPENLEGAAKDAYMQARFDSMLEAVDSDKTTKVNRAVSQSRVTRSDSDDLNERFRKAQQKTFSNKIEASA